MSHMSYNRVGKNGMRGFRLAGKRFSIQRLRAKFFLFFKVITRWKSTYGNAFESLKRSLTRNNGASRRRDGCGGINIIGSTSSRRTLVRKDVTKVYQYRLKSFGRSNSFYSEAIADCLEFIKRTSVSSEDKESEDKEEED